VGLLLGYAVIGVSQRVLGSRGYTVKVVQVVRLLAFIAWEIITASLALAWLVIQPRPALRPGVVAVPLEARTDLEITILANVITLSPGTLSLDVAADRGTLYIHTIYFRRIPGWSGTVLDELAGHYDPNTHELR